jgi:hypothetical protein
MPRLHESLLAARQTIAAPRRSGGDSPALQLSGQFPLFIFMFWVFQVPSFLTILFHVSNFSEINFSIQCSDLAESVPIINCFTDPNPYL